MLVLYGHCMGTAPLWKAYYSGVFGQTWGLQGSICIFFTSLCLNQISQSVCHVCSTLFWLPNITDDCRSFQTCIAAEECLCFDCSKCFIMSPQVSKGEGEEMTKATSVVPQSHGPYSFKFTRSLTLAFLSGECHLNYIINTIVLEDVFRRCMSN